MSWSKEETNFLLELNNTDRNGTCGFGGMKCKYSEKELRICTVVEGIISKP